jgi:hypothetical protein
LPHVDSRPKSKKRDGRPDSTTILLVHQAIVLIMKQDTQQFGCHTSFAGAASSMARGVVELVRSIACCSSCSMIWKTQVSVAERIHASHANSKMSPGVTTRQNWEFCNCQDLVVSFYGVEVWFPSQQR